MSVCVRARASVRDGFADLGFYHPAEPAASSQRRLRRRDSQGPERGAARSAVGLPLALAGQAWLGRCVCARGPACRAAPMTRRVSVCSRESSELSQPRCPVWMPLVLAREEGAGSGRGGYPGREELLVTKSLLLASADHGPARRSPARSAAARGEAQSAGVLTGSAICASGDLGRRLLRAARAPPALRAVPRPRPRCLLEAAAAGRGRGRGPAWMAETSRRRRICYRTAGAWATAAPPPPRASPPPAPPRNRPRISSPESTSRRRCRWLRTQVSVRLGRVRCRRPCRNRQQCPVQERPPLRSSEQFSELRFHFPAQCRAGRAHGLVRAVSSSLSRATQVHAGKPESKHQTKPSTPSHPPPPLSAEVNSEEASFLHFAFTSLRRSASETRWRFLHGQNDCAAGGGGQGASGPRISEQCAPGER